MKERGGNLYKEESVKPRPNDRNIQRNMSQHCWPQHVRAFGHPVATCCDMLRVVGSNLKMVKFVARLGLGMRTSYICFLKRHL